MARIVDLLELIAACLAKDPARRPAPGQVAAYCATAAGQLGLLMTTSGLLTWPDTGIVCADSVSGFDPTRPSVARAYDYLLGGCFL
jgi:hypothetical protein